MNIRRGEAERSEQAVSRTGFGGCAPKNIVVHMCTCAGRRPSNWCTPQSIPESAEPTRCSRAKRASRVTETGFGGCAPKQIGAPGRAQPPITPDASYAEAASTCRCPGREEAEGRRGNPSPSKTTGACIGPPVSRSEPGPYRKEHCLSRARLRARAGAKRRAGPEPFPKDSTTAGPHPSGRPERPAILSLARAGAGAERAPPR